MGWHIPRENLPLLKVNIHGATQPFCTDCSSIPFNFLCAAAERLGSIYCQSIMSNNTFKEVEAVAPGGRRWAQLYLLNNQSETEILIRKAENAGVEALVITIDGPYYGKRRGCIRHPFDFPSRLR